MHPRHGVIHLLHGDPASEHGGHCEVAASPGVAGRHAAAGLEQLLDQLRHAQLLESCVAAADERRQAGHEEVEAGEGNHVDRQLAQVSVELAGEPEAGGHTGHGDGHQVVEVTVGGGAQLQGPGQHGTVTLSLQKRKPLT